MRERQAVAVDAIVSHQNPPRQTLIELAASVGDRGMSSLNHEGLHVTTGCC